MESSSATILSYGAVGVGCGQKGRREKQTERSEIENAEKTRWLYNPFAPHGKLRRIDDIEIKMNARHDEELLQAARSTNRLGIPTRELAVGVNGNDFTSV